MQKFREKQKEDEMREAAEKLRKEREEDKKHKELVRQQIARDRSGFPARSIVACIVK